MHETRSLRVVFTGIQLDELTVVYFEEYFGGRAVLVEYEGFFESQFSIELAGGSEIRNANCRMCNRERGSRLWQLLRFHRLEHDSKRDDQQARAQGDHFSSRARAAHITGACPWKSPVFRGRAM